MAAERRRQKFEDLYGRLEETVAKLEKGGLTLDETLALYEQGMGLAQRCQEMLQEAELKITRLKEALREPQDEALRAEPQDETLRPEPDEGFAAPAAVEDEGEAEGSC